MPLLIKILIYGNNNRIMETISSFISFIANVKIGQFYPLAVAISSCVSSIATLILSIFIKKLRNYDKTLLIVLTIISYLTCAFKIYCDVLKGKPINTEIICFSIFLCAVSFSLLSISVLLSNLKKMGKYTNNQLIDIFPNVNEPFKYSNTLEGELFKTPFKRIEYLKTDKMFSDLADNNFGINYSQILQFIAELKDKDLNEVEKEQLSNLECDVVKFAHVKSSDFERYEFSNKLSNLFKLMSKYA